MALTVVPSNTLVKHMSAPVSLYFQVVTELIEGTEATKPLPPMRIHHTTYIWYDDNADIIYRVVYWRPWAWLSVDHNGVDRLIRAYLPLDPEVTQRLRFKGSIDITDVLIDHPRATVADTMAVSQYVVPIAKGVMMYMADTQQEDMFYFTRVSHRSRREGVHPMMLVHESGLDSVSLTYSFVDHLLYPHSLLDLAQEMLATSSSWVTN